MVAGLVRGRLEGPAKGRCDPRVRLWQVDADHLSIRIGAVPMMFALSVHSEQTTDWSAGFNRFGDRAQMTTK
jgi:hypothetical protein